MAEATLPHNLPETYEPSLFGTYSKKIGMWLFLLSDSLTFGALLYSYSYGRISIANWPTPFHSESIVNATIMTAFLLTSSLTMVLAVRAAVHGDGKAHNLAPSELHGYAADQQQPGVEEHQRRQGQRKPVVNQGVGTRVESWQPLTHDVRAGKRNKHHRDSHDAHTQSQPGPPQAHFQLRQAVMGKALDTGYSRHQSL